MIAYTREDIRHSVAAAEDVGELEEAEEEMLYKVFDFASKEVSAVMVPRPEVVGIAVDMPPEEALRAVVDSPYTRYPVYRGSLDDIVGVLHVRDLFGAMHDLGLASVELESIVRPAYVVPETKDLAALLADFRREKQHMAIVIDEYGDMEGIVTLEDLLEEIVGDIEDEFDLPDTSIERIDETHIRIDGTYTIDDFNEEFGTELEQEDFHTMAGLVFGELGRAPEVGDAVRSRRAPAQRPRGRRLADHEDRGRVRRGRRDADGRAGRRVDSTHESRRRIRAPAPRLRSLLVVARHRGVRAADGVRRDRLAGLLGPGEPARPRARRARGVPPACFCSRFRPGIWRIASRAGTCSP